MLACFSGRARLLPFERPGYDPARLSLPRALHHTLHPRIPYAKNICFRLFDYLAIATKKWSEWLLGDPSSQLPAYLHNRRTHPAFVFTGWICLGGACALHSCYHWLCLGRRNINR